MVNPFLKPEEIVILPFEPSAEGLHRLRILTGEVGHKFLEILGTGPQWDWATSILQTARWSYGKHPEYIDQKSDAQRAQVLSLRAVTAALALCRLSKTLSLGYGLRQDALNTAEAALEGARRNLEWELTR